MKVQHENKVMSSFLQFVDHEVCSKGEAFTNHSSFFYPTSSLYNGYYTYSSPFKQFVADTSVSNASVMTNVYVNGSPVAVNSNDFEGINHYEGQVYFSSDQSSKVISGNYSAKDFNVYLTSEPEEKILFEEKYHINPKTSQVLSGLAPDTQTYPAIYLKNNGGTNIPFAFGGIDNTKVNVRAIVLADSAFSLDAVCGILKDTHKKSVPIIENLPFNAMNAYTGANYDYTGLATGLYGPLIWDVFVSKNVTRGAELSHNVFSAFVDFQLWEFRTI